MRSPDVTPLRLVAYSGALVFVIIVVAEHFLSPGLGLARHMISEYANGSNGLLMTLGFGAWAASLAATGALPARSRLVRILLWTAAAAVAVLMVFHTQTVVGQLPPGEHWNIGGRLHDLGSGGLTAALFIGAALNARHKPAIAVLVAAAVIVQVSLLAVGPSVGGVRERCLLALAIVWQILYLRDRPLGL